MISSKHTNGEWFYEPVPGASQSMVTNGESIIAGIPNIDGCEETAANGHLIASAPGLLQACQKMLLLTLKCSRHYRSNDEREAILLAQKAITKSRG